MNNVNYYLRNSYGGEEEEEEEGEGFLCIDKLS